MCDNDNFIFEPLSRFQEWRGFYDIIPGHTTTFTTIYCQGYGFWPIIRYYSNDELLVCLALAGGDVKKLVAAVSRAKMIMTNSQGGSFIINEFGQVIVPSSDGCGRRLLVGECAGPLLFEVGDEIIDLSDDCDLETGECWEKPYIGVRYRLHNANFIYFWNDYVVEPMAQDVDLICKMRSIREFGAATFIVNPYGIVLMKSRVGAFSFDEERWTGFYVGRINYDLWFAKEEL